MCVCVRVCLYPYGKNATSVILSKLVVFYLEFLGQMMNKQEEKRNCVPLPRLSFLKQAMLKQAVRT